MGDSIKFCVKVNKELPLRQEFSSTTDIIAAIIEMFKDVLQQVMESELDIQLGYEKGERK
jgi:hypothetical protein